MKILFERGLRFHELLTRLIFSHSFILITLFGNLIILTFSLVFYLIESAPNDSIKTFLDAIWWGFATATTVGYGDIIPVTAFGKILGIALMLTGTALFATYTALFAQTILADEFLPFGTKPQSEKRDCLLNELKKHRNLINKQIKHYEKQQGE